MALEQSSLKEMTQEKAIQGTHRLLSYMEELAGPEHASAAFTLENSGRSVKLREVR